MKDSVRLIFEYVAAALQRGRRLVALCAMCAAVAQVGAAQKVKIDADPNFDFSKVHRYEWRTHPLFEKHPELKDQYSTAIQLVTSDTNQVLMKKGYHPAESTPDIFLTFFVTAENMARTYTDMIGPSGAYYGWYGWYAPPVWTVTRTEQYLQGTLVMDMVDPKTMTLVWRASATDSIEDFRKRDENVNDAVNKIFKKFPPKQKKG